MGSNDWRRPVVVDVVVVDVDVGEAVCCVRDVVEAGLGIIPCWGGAGVVGGLRLRHWPPRSPNIPVGVGVDVDRWVENRWVIVVVPWWEWRERDVK